MKTLDLLLVLVLGLLAACKLPISAPPPPTVPTGVLCTSENLIPPYNCGTNYHTPEGYGCAVCDPANSACVTTDFVYCTGLLGCDDPLCQRKK